MADDRPSDQLFRSRQQRLERAVLLDPPLEVPTVLRGYQRRVSRLWCFGLATWSFSLLFPGAFYRSSSTADRGQRRRRRRRQLRLPAGQRVPICLSRGDVEFGRKLRCGVIPPFCRERTPRCLLLVAPPLRLRSSRASKGVQGAEVRSRRSGFRQVWSLLSSFAASLTPRPPNPTPSIVCFALIVVWWDYTFLLDRDCSFTI